MLLAVSYDPWAEYYDEVYVDQHTSGDREFYVREACGAGGAVLEVACGTGRILLPGLAAGADIDGFDLSSAMLDKLAEAAARKGLRATVWQDDMRSFQAPRRYALAMVPFRAFLHLLTTADQLAALERIRACLLPGGRLLLNVFHPSYSVTVSQVDKPLLDDEFVHRATNRHTRLWHTIHNGLVNQVKRVVCTFEELDDTGAVARTVETDLILAWIFKAQMELLLRVAGFARWQIYGGFDRRPLARDDEEMVVEAWAPNAGE
jgi:SAM-dependent methyltransferase